MVAIATLCFATMGWSLWMGFEGLVNGEILVRPKNGTPFLAQAQGPHAGAFHAYTLGFLLMGLVFAVIGVAVLRSLRARSPRRR